MKLSALALDYDGTIARDDAVDPRVRDAIARARQAGIFVLLVTGRILDDLRRAAGDLHFVDAVVAENGAVIHFPQMEFTRSVAPAVPATFVAELRRRGITASAGKCLVDADARDAQQILEIIRVLELPMVLAFNRGRVMSLPQGVSKATGLKAILDTMRLSARNAVAIGDAENDHELLRCAEVGVAVEWGSRALQEAADMSLAGSGPGAVAGFIEHLAQTGRVPVPPRARRRLHLGFTDDGREFSLAVRGRNVLVAGDAKSGKSWVAGLLCEQLIMHGYCVCVIDPEGDYRSLEGLPGVMSLGGDDPLPSPRELQRALRYPDRSVVIDLSRTPQDRKIEYVRAVLPALNELRRKTGLPHRILLDEAHYFLHDADAHRLLDLERDGYTIVTYWATRLPRELLADTEVMIVTRESSLVEIESLRQWCSNCRQVDGARWSALRQLKWGQAMALPITEEAGGVLQVFTLGPRVTPHVRHREKYIDVPVSEQRGFVFRASGTRPVRRAYTLRQFVDELESAPPQLLEPYIARGDFSRWIADVFGDHMLASNIRRVEGTVRSGTGCELVPEIAAVIRARYDFSEDEEVDTQANRSESAQVLPLS